MKKLLLLLLAASMLVACGKKENSTSTTTDTNTASEQLKKIDKLSFQFVPSKDADVIISGTKNLPELVKKGFEKYGYEIGDIEITVGSNYAATAEALAAGTVDVGWLPGGTYALYSQDVDVVLTAQRNGLSNDSEDPKAWNGDANATTMDGPMVSYYRSIMIAGPTEYGKKLAEKVNKGEKLTWEELNGASWGVANNTSSSGYIYPSLWLKSNYGKTIKDLEKVQIVDGGYGVAIANLAAEQVDIIAGYADLRVDYADAWKLATSEQDKTGKTGLGREDSIWNEANVIAVTDKIYNDTVSVTKKKAELYNDEFKAALQNTLIDVIGTPEGKEIFAVYSHKGYAKATDADYDAAREALKISQE